MVTQKEKGKKIRVADYVAKFISDLGVKCVFLVPGGGAMFLNDAVAQNKNLAFVANHNEQASSICAEAYSRVSENIGVAMVTTGPGSTNAITGVVGAWIESVPLLIVSGQVKRQDLTLHSGVRQKGPQEVGIVPIVESVTKYAKTLRRPEDIKYELERAVFLAKDSRKGPVWIDIPLDVQASLIDPNTLRGFSPKAVVKKSSELKYKKIAQLVHKAERPLLLIGHGVRLSGAEKKFKKLAKALKIPVVFTWNALDLMEHKNPLNIGRPGTVALRAPNFAVQNCDLLIAIGARLDNVVTAYNPANFAKYAKKVFVDIDPNELKKFDHQIDFKICEDAGAFLTSLLAQIDAKSMKKFDEWIAICNRWKEKYRVNDGMAFPKKGAIGHLQFVDKLSDVLPEKSVIVTGSSGLAIESFYTAFRNKRNQRVFLTSGLGAMGYGIPAMIGASAVASIRDIYGVESDGSLMMNIQELASLKAIGKKIKIFIMNNDGYASIRNTQKNYFKGRSIATDIGSKLFIPSISGLADAFGFKSICIKKISELERKLKQVVALNDSVICEVVLKSDDALWPKSAAIPQKNGSMLSMPLEDMSPLLSREELREQMIVPLALASKRIKD
jgi:acetolactate synthase-1/2/3 large subunit